MLKFDTASKIPKASCGNVTNFVLGIRSQIVQLKASFWFWVFPCKHPLRRLFRTRLLENMLHMLNNRLRQTRPWFVPLGSIWAELLKNTPAILTSRAISRMVVVCWRRCNMKQGCILHFLQLSKILSDCDAVVSSEAGQLFTSPTSHVLSILWPFSSVLRGGTQLSSAHGQHTGTFTQSFLCK